MTRMWATLTVVAIAAVLLGICGGYLWLLGWLLDDHYGAWYTTVAMMPLLVFVVWARPRRGKRKRR
ncbi:hypothetical protein [Micromonospora sp. NPDC004551]|uniref:hypothetical protein n=1 Tax=Micromonospora sp. NPDC004551 TaxID=3154284 RepID=UPI0033A573E2